MTYSQKQLLRGSLVIITFVLAMSLVCAAEDPYMWARIYHESVPHGSESPQVYPALDVSQRPKLKDTMSHDELPKTEIIFDRTVKQFPCGAQGKYYMAVSSAEPQEGILSGDGVTACNGMGGDYGYIYDCYLYTVDYDSQQERCEQENSSCFGYDVAADKEIVGLWDPAADTPDGECCGDDPAGINPDGTMHNIDDPDMGQVSCEFCRVGLNNISISGEGPQGGLREWSTFVSTANPGEGCCGDEIDDCVELMYDNDHNQWLCWDYRGTYYPGSPEVHDPGNPEIIVDPGSPASYSGGTWHWWIARDLPGVTLDVSCAPVSVVSDGSEWIGCENSSFGVLQNQVCLFSMSTYENAHIGFCDEVGNKVYCKPREYTSQLHCEIRDSCGADTVVLKLSAESNAHAATADSAVNYPKKLCCNLNGQPVNIVNTGRDDQFIVALSDTENAHISRNHNDPDYNIRLYFAEDISCGLVQQLPAYEGTKFGLDVNNPYKVDGHDYICHYGGAAQIAECCGGTQPSPNGHCNSTIEGYEVDSQNYGGIRKNAGESVLHNITGIEQTWYCTSSYEWTQDLDIYDQWSCDRVLNKDYALFRWTGNYCCGEADDIEEFYIDAGGPGICWNSTFKPNGTLLTHAGHAYNELLVSGGTLQGCAIDEANAGADPEKYLNDTNKPYNGSFTTSNDWLFKLRDYPNSQENKNNNTAEPQLITDNDYCTVFEPVAGGKQYFCSYKEVWAQDEKRTNRTHLSYIEWDLPDDDHTQRAECCKEEQCWDGGPSGTCYDCQGCVYSYHEDTKKTFIPGDHYIVIYDDRRALRCLYGEWVEQPRKYKWDNSKWGYCPLESQCLVDPDGKFEHNGMPEAYNPNYPADNPQCINNTQFIQDHYCDNGNWTTRTKFLILQLLDYAGSGEYTLFCDSYQNTLNQYDYRLTTGFTHQKWDCTLLGEHQQQIFKTYLGNERKQGCFTNCTEGMKPYQSETDCANNFCVLHAKGRTLVAASLNQPINSPYYPFLDLLNKKSCSIQAGDQYHACDGSNQLWYNDAFQSVIFSTDSISLGGVSWWDAFMSKLKSWIDMIVDLFTETYKGAYPFVNDNPQIRTMYSDRHGNKQVFALLEKGVYLRDEQPAGRPDDYLSITYKGFNVDICEAFNAHPSLANQQLTYTCAYDNSKDAYEITATTGSSIFALWQDFTAKLRVQK